MRKKKLLVIFFLFIFFCLVFLAGFFVANVACQTCEVNNNSEKNNQEFTRGWESAFKRISEVTGIEIEESSNSINKLRGAIQKIENNRILLKIKPISFYDDPDLDIRIILIDDKTKFTKIVTKEYAQYQNELNEYFKTIEDVSEEEYYSNAPRGYTEESIDLDDLEIGQNIEVKTEADIRTVKQFNVETVTVTK